MSDPRSRRALLAALGTVTLGGCTAEDRFGTATQSPTGTASATDTATATDSPSPTDATESETATDSPTPTAEPPTELRSAWSMPAADSGLSNAQPAASGPTTAVRPLWRVTAQAELSTPVVAGSRLFVGGDDGVVRVFDARTGKRKWSKSVGTRTGAPWVESGRCVVPTETGIVALAVADGRELWRVETPSRGGRLGDVESGVLVASHGVYWTQRGGEGSDGAPPRLVALDASDGTERWRVDLGDAWEPRPFASDEFVFVPSGTRDFRFWQFEASSGDQIGDDPRYGADFPGERCYAGGRVYAVDGFFGGVKATAVTDEGTGWQVDVPPGGGVSSLAVGSELVFYTSNAEKGGVIALSRSDGSRAWRKKPESEITGRPVVADEALLVPTKAGHVCLDPTDGTELWTADLGPRRDGVIVVDDVVYAVEGSELRAFRPPSE
ncbi:MAG: PQQ-binding-like beta-propeller repeat protein [Halobaculum sp.]